MAAKHAPSSDAASEFEIRRASVSEGLAARKLDALLVSFSPNLRYLTGFTGSNGCLLVTPGKSILFTDPRYQIQAAQETSTQVKICKGPLVTDTLAAIARLGLRQVGYEPARMTCDALRSAEGPPAHECSADAGPGLDRGTAHGEISAGNCAHPPFGGNQFAGLRTSRGACAARHDGAGPGGRTGIPHAPPGRGEAVVRDHRGRRSRAPRCRTPSPPPRRFARATWWWWTWARFRTVMPAT